jgi:5-methylcytosine-specific restriction enzyme A
MVTRNVWPRNTQRWQRLRRLKLATHPLCEACLKAGRIEPATAVHHRVRITAGGAAFPHLDQLASLCAPCHNSETRFEQTGRRVIRRGCDTSGQPLDPAHPWYQTAKPK